MGNKFQTKINFFQKGLDNAHVALIKNYHNQHISMQWMLFREKHPLITIEDARQTLANYKTESTVLSTKMGLYAIIVDSIKRLKELEESNEL